ncbi:hypothetical protein [Microbulbifer sp. TYP-18]|uniref:hypothetical protein n=1 Tax=Microbulbifer sp. TYP-18 TaxID=3230024 RepID=UPI0034C68A61
MKKIISKTISYAKVPEFVAILALSAAFSSGTQAHPCTYTDPIVIDLGADGIEFAAPGKGVRFDISANGRPAHIQWVMAGGNEAFVVLDRNDNGIVDDGSELFGNATELHDGSGTLAANGFLAMAQYDSPLLGGNDDGMLSEADVIWSDLKLWLDKNADGVSDVDEIMSLAESGVESLPTIPRKNPNRHDAAGNLMPYWAHGQLAASKSNDGGEKLVKTKVVDVFFQIIGH